MNIKRVKNKRPKTKRLDNNYKKFVITIAIFIFILTLFNMYSYISKLNYNEQSKIEVKQISARANTANISVCIDIPPPIITDPDPSVENASVGVNFTLQINATSPSNNTIYYLDNSTFFNISETTGLIYFVPTSVQRGTHIFIITATHNICENINDTISLYIQITGEDEEEEEPQEIGGSGGGNGAYYINRVRKCEESWICEPWSDCTETEKQEDITICNDYDIEKENCGYKTRKCIDINLCNTEIKKPIEKIPCNIQTQESIPIIEEKQMSIWWLILINLLVALLLAYTIYKIFEKEKIKIILIKHMEQGKLKEQTAIIATKKRLQISKIIRNNLHLKPELKQEKIVVQGNHMKSIEKELINHGFNKSQIKEFISNY